MRLFRKRLAFRNDYDKMEVYRYSFMISKMLGFDMLFSSWTKESDIIRKECRRFANRIYDIVSDETDMNCDGYDMLKNKYDNLDKEFYELKEENKSLKKELDALKKKMDIDAKRV